MRIKAKLVYAYCSEHTKPISKCDYDRYDEDYLNCECANQFRGECLNKGYKTKYIDRNYKELEYTIQNEEEIIVLKLGNEIYMNDNNYMQEIEYLYIDDEKIVEDYKIIRDYEEEGKEK